MRSLFAIICLLVGAVGAEAATHCVRSAASGSATGNDWTNAFTALPATLTRGDTYYIAAGTYVGHRYNDTESGTTRITILGATIADHGIATNWSNAFGVDAVSGGAQWGDYSPIDKGYYTLDGNVGSGKTYTNYGFTYTATASPQFSIQFGETTNVVINGIILKHLGFKAIAGDVNKQALFCFTQLGAIPGLDVENCCFDGFQNAIACNGTQVGGTNTGWIFKFNYCVNGFSSATNHGEQINANGCPLIAMIIAFNVFDTCVGTAIICANNNNIDCTGATTTTGVFGNVFVNCQSGGNGMVAGTSGGNLVNVPVYNNTFSGNTGGNWIGGPGNSGVLAKNNLIFNQVATYTGQGTADFNSYFQCTSIPTETNGQTSSSNPFTNSATGDFHLANDTSAWTSLSSPFNTDPDGITRTSSRGAYQYVPAGGPTFVSATIASNGTALSVVFSASVSIGAGGNAGMKITISGVDYTATFVSGSGSTTLVYSVTTVPLGAVALNSYVQPGNGIEATTGGADTSSYSGNTVTNNSTQLLAVVGGANPSTGGVLSGSP